MKRLFLIIALVLVANPSYAVKQYVVRQADVEGLGARMQREIESLQYLLNAYQTRQFFQLPTDTARVEWLNRYWKSRDPTPTTDENEMRTEHLVRSRLARQLFKSKRWPGWDKRGEVFIRYGAPNLRSTIHAEVTARKTHPPGELWYYGRHGMMVIFRDESLTGHYIYAINALGAVQDITPELAEFLIYDTDVSITAIIPDEYLQFYRDPEFDIDSIDPNWTMSDEWERGIPRVRYTRPRVQGTTESWDDLMDPDLARLLPPEGPAGLFMVDKAAKLAYEFEATLEDTPSAYPFNFESNTFPFFYGIDQFKGGDGVNRVEVNIELPIEPTTDEEAGATRQFTATAVFWDTDYNEVARREQKVVVPVVKAGDEEKLWPVQLVFTLEDNYYRMAVTVSELRAMLRVKDDSTRSVEGSTRESSYRSTVGSRDFTGELALSDILFAQRIGQTDKPSPFTRGALEVVPHPYRRYRQGTAMPFYFEIYNLTVDEDGLSRYNVEYRIIPHSPAKRRFWDRFDNVIAATSSQFSGSGYGPDETLYISVRTENLAPGTYDLLITVECDQSRELTFRQATFRIVEATR